MADTVVTLTLTGTELEVPRYKLSFVSTVLEGFGVLGVDVLKDVSVDAEAVAASPIATSSVTKGTHVESTVTGHGYLTASIEKGIYVESCLKARGSLSAGIISDQLWLLVQPKSIIWEGRPPK